MLHRHHRPEVSHHVVVLLLLGLMLLQKHSAHRIHYVRLQDLLTVYLLVGIHELILKLELFSLYLRLVIAHLILALLSRAQLCRRRQNVLFFTLKLLLARGVDKEFWSSLAFFLHVTAHLSGQIDLTVVHGDVGYWEVCEQAVLAHGLDEVVAGQLLGSVLRARRLVDL